MLIESIYDFHLMIKHLQDNFESSVFECLLENTEK